MKPVAVGLDIIELLCYYGIIASHTRSTRRLVPVTARVTRERIAEKQLPVQDNYRNRETFNGDRVGRPAGRSAPVEQADKLYLSPPSLPLGARG